MSARIKWMLVPAALFVTALVAVAVAIGGHPGGNSTPAPPGVSGGNGNETGEQPHQTLLRAVNGGRMEELSLTRVSVGKSGLSTDALRVVGTADTPDKYIWVEELTIDGLVAPQLELKNMIIHRMIIQDNIADGKSFSQTNGDAPNVVLGSTRGMSAPERYQDETFDRAEISVSSSDAFIKRIVITDVKAFGEGALFQYLRVGTLTIRNSTIGKGDGIDTPDFIIYNTVVVGPPVTSKDNKEVETNVQ